MCRSRLLFAGVILYQYDDLGRIIAASHDNGGGKTYSYDSVGNRLDKTTVMPQIIVYEDGEDATTSGWEVYDNDPSGAFITNVDDADRGSRVIEFTGSGTGNGYRLRNPDGSWWNNGAHKVIE